MEERIGTLQGSISEIGELIRNDDNTTRSVVKAPKLNPSFTVDTEHKVPRNFTPLQSHLDPRLISFLGIVIPNTCHYQAIH